MCKCQIKSQSYQQLNSDLYLPGLYEFDLPSGGPTYGLALYYFILE
jgi:hypothetical protein